MNTLCPTRKHVAEDSCSHVMAFNMWLSFEHLCPQVQTTKANAKWRLATNALSFCLLSCYCPPTWSKWADTSRKWCPCPTPWACFGDVCFHCFAVFNTNHITPGSVLPSSCQSCRLISCSRIETLMPSTGCVWLPSNCPSFLFAASTPRRPQRWEWRQLS